jgi:hypothetical protein
LGNNTSNGCEFYAVEMDTTDEAIGTCYAVFLVNQWTTGQPARVLVTLAGQDLPPIEQYARIPTGTGTGITYGPYDGQAGLPTGEIAILFLSRDLSAEQETPSTSPRYLAGCPAGVTPALTTDAAQHGTNYGTAFRIQTNVPVVAYQMLPYGGGRARITGATLLMPTNTWDTNYVIANAYGGSPLFNPDPPLGITADFRAGPTMVVIASQDDTHVTINPKVDITANLSVPGTTAGTAATYALNQGQYLQITPDDPDGFSTNNLELTGSALQSDKPVGVIGGSTIMDVPADAGTSRADHAEQMLPPVRALGSEYVAVRYRNRWTDAGDESPPWRLVGVVDGTLVTFDPPRSAVNFAARRNGVPFDPSVNGSINSIQLAAGDLVEFNDPGTFVATSQDANHPFFFASYMTGGCQANPDTDNYGGECPPGIPFNGFGDPEFIVVVPPAQFLPRYTFFTDPTYPETNLVIVRVRDEASGQWPDVALDCPAPPPVGAGVLTGWTPVGSSGKYEMTRWDLSTGNFAGANGCNNGPHSITASFAAPTFGGAVLTPRLGVTIWGWGNDQTYPYDGDGPNSLAEDESDPRFSRWVSYGYPAGANFQPLNTAVMSTQP